MAHQPIPASDLHPSGAEGPAAANGGSVPVRTGSMLVVYLNVTSAASGSGGFWLQGINPSSVWFDLPCDLVLVGAATGAQVTAVVNKRNINGDSLVTAAGKYTAVYKHLPCSAVRLAWNITAGTLTFDASGDAK